MYNNVYARISSSLRNCAKGKDIVLGKYVHGLIIESGLEQRKDLCNLLIQLYGSYGAIHDALSLFIKLPWTRHVTLFNIFLSHFAREKNSQVAMAMYNQLSQEGIIPDKISYMSVVSACASEKNLEEGRRLHCGIFYRDGNISNDVSICTTIMNMYGKCEYVGDARDVFNQVVVRDVVCWTAMISIYAQHGHDIEALQLFEEMMHCDGVEPNEATFGSVLKVCVGLRDLRKGKFIHHCIVEFGFESHVVDGNVLLDVYGRYGSMEDAEKIFLTMPKQDVATWNAMINLYVSYNQEVNAFHCFVTMRESGVLPNKITLIGMLCICSTYDMLGLGEWLHSLIVDLDLDLDDVAMCNALLSMYGKCGNTIMVQELFDEMMVRNIVSWNGLLSVYVRREEYKGLLMLSEQMECEGILPDKVTSILILTVCARAKMLTVGKQIHSSILYSSYPEIDVVVGNSLVNMYAKCEDFTNAQKVYNSLQATDIFSYNAVIEMLIKQNQTNGVFQIFQQVLQEGLMPRKVTFMCLLSACKGSNMLTLGKQVHSYIQNSELLSDTMVGNALVNMYWKCESLRNAETVFDAILQWDQVSWNSMMQVWASYGFSDKVHYMFYQMIMEGEVRDKVTFLNATYSACTYSATLKNAKHIHTYINANGFQKDIAVKNILIRMYSKCGSLDEARVIFDDDDEIIPWHAMMVSYVEQGKAIEAFVLFNQMQEQGEIPDETSFVCALSACASHSVLSQGMRLHASIECDSIGMREVVVGNSLINMYAKCGNIVSARHVFQQMENHDMITWTTLISMYAQNGQIENALQSLHEMQDKGVKPNDITFLNILNGCTHTGSVDACIRFTLQGCDGGGGMLSMCDHFVSIIDLLGRAGKLEEAEELIKLIPFEPSVVPYIALLASCKHEVDVTRGLHAARKVFELDPRNTAAYVLLSNTMFVGEHHQWE